MSNVFTSYNTCRNYRTHRDNNTLTSINKHVEPYTERIKQYQYVSAEVAYGPCTLKRVLVTLELHNTDTVHWILHRDKATKTTWTMDSTVRQISILALENGGP